MYFTAVCRSGQSRPLLARQTIKFMKLTTVLLLAACLQVSANGFSQRVTIKENNVTLRKVFEEIRKQTGVQFFYAVNTMQVTKPVSISVKNEPLDKVLEQCFRDQELTYTISDNTIIVKRKVITPEVNDPPLPMPEPVNTVIKGQVTDDKGQPLTGVSVTIKGSSTGVVTDANGNYSISVPEESVLVFSYVGFTNVEMRTAGRSIIDVSLKPKESSLNEVVVVGYGTQKKRDLTGSVSSIKGSEVADMPSTNPIASLQGKVPGLTISNTGRAGASPVVRLRLSNLCSYTNDQVHGRIRVEGHSCAQ